MKASGHRGMGWRIDASALLAWVVMVPAFASELTPQPATPSLEARAKGEATPAAVPVVAAPTADVRPLYRDYLIGSDDLLEIQVFGVDQLSRSVRVNARGQMSLPLIGTLDVGGLTAHEAETLIARKLGESFLQNPQVSLFIKEYTSQRVTVEGAVNRPGIYPLKGPITLLQALALAGGQGPLSDMKEVMLFRFDATGARQTKSFDVEEIRSGKADDPFLVNDDVVVVKRAPKREVLRDSLFRDIVDTINPFR